MAFNQELTEAKERTVVVHVNDVASNFMSAVYYSAAERCIS